MLPFRNFLRPNDLIRDLGLPKEGAEHLASVLKKKICYLRAPKLRSTEIEIKNSVTSFLKKKD